MAINTENEIWKDVKGYEGEYQVSNLGRVKSLPREIRNGEGTTRKIGGYYLKTHSNKNDYVKVNLSGKSFRVHRLVAEAFIPNEENKPQINHINGIKCDNRIENLEWCTSKHNMNHNLVLGVTPLGEKHKKSKLNSKQVLEIKRLIKEGKQHKEIAKIYGVSDRTINAINKNLIWKHVKAN